MRIIIATTQVPFVRGGAEALAEALCSALHADGHTAEIVALPFKWYPAERILDHMLAWRLLDLTASPIGRVDLLIGLRFPAYLADHPNKVLWLVHQYRTAYDLWNHPLGDLRTQANGVQVRDAIIEADRTLIPQARATFAISRTVAARLQRYSGVGSAVLYPPPLHAEQFYCACADDYVFFPSRLSPLKRQALVLQALAHTRHAVRVHFSGLPDEPAYGSELEALAEALGVQERVTWLGYVGEDDKRWHFAHALGVVFPPFDEDYGYVALEAMLAAKPVITCTDSGGPLEFVEHARTGLVAAPTPVSLAAALDALWEDRAQAAAWGREGRDRFDALGIDWRTVVRTLVA